jgi:hypothetical protein
MKRSSAKVGLALTSCIAVFAKPSKKRVYECRITYDGAFLFTSPMEKRRGGRIIHQFGEQRGV